MISNRVFYKTIVKIEILSEDLYPSPELQDLATIHYDITCGDCSGVIKLESQEKLDGKQAATELELQGSDPDFFNLTSDGEDIEEEE